MRVLCALLLPPIGLISGSITYSLYDDFSNISNPSGRWTYANMSCGWGCSQQTSGLTLSNYTITNSSACYASSASSSGCYIYKSSDYVYFDNRYAAPGVVFTTSSHTAYYTVNAKIGIQGSCSNAQFGSLNNAGRIIGVKPEGTCAGFTAAYSFYFSSNLTVQPYSKVYLYFPMKGASGGQTAVSLTLTESTPTSQPTSQPSNPTSQPSRQPSSQPTCPSSQPTRQPSGQPSTRSSSQPPQHPVPAPLHEPSSQPTAEPSATHILRLNPLHAIWSPAYITAKASAYYIYLVFFLSLFLLLAAADFFGVMNRFDKLSDSSFASRVWQPCELTQQGDGCESDVVLVEEIKKSERSRCAAQRAQTESSTKLGQGRGSGNIRDSRDGGDTASVKLLSRVKGDMLNKLTRSQQLYSDEFHDYILLSRCFYGCSDLLYAGGCSIPFTETALPPGLIEDFLLFLLNNHSVICCFSSTRESPLSRQGRRIILICQHALGFFLSLIIVCVLSTFMARIPVLKPFSIAFSQANSDPLHNVALNVFTDMVVISPVVYRIGGSLMALYLLTPQVDEGEQFALLFVKSNFQNIVVALLLAAVLTSLFFAAMLSAGEPFLEACLGNIYQYLYLCLLPALIIDIAVAVASFEYRFHYAVYFLGTPLVVVGRYFVERYYLHDASGAVFEQSSRYTLFGSLRIDSICRREAAPTATVDSLFGSCSVELLPLTTNPLHDLQIRQQIFNEMEEQTSSAKSHSSERRDNTSLVPNPKLRQKSSRPGARIALTAPPPPPAPQRQQQVPCPPAAVQGDDDASEAVETGVTGDVAVILGEDISLRRFGEGVDKGFTNVFHFFQARDKGYTDAENVEDAPIDDLRRAAHLCEEEAPPARVSVLALAEYFEKRTSLRRSAYGDS